MKFVIEKHRKGYALYRILEDGTRELVSTYKTQRAAEVRMTIEYDRAKQS